MAGKDDKLKRVCTRQGRVLVREVIPLKPLTRKRKRRLQYATVFDRLLDEGSFNLRTRDPIVRRRDD